MIKQPIIISAGTTSELQMNWLICSNYSFFPASENLLKTLMGLPGVLPVLRDLSACSRSTGLTASDRFFEATQWA